MPNVAPEASVILRFPGVDIRASAVCDILPLDALTASRILEFSAAVLIVSLNTTEFIPVIFISPFSL